MESRVCVLLLPELRVINAMVVIGRVTQRETKAHIGTGHTKSLQHDFRMLVPLQRPENEQSTSVIGSGTKRRNRELFGYKYSFPLDPLHDNCRVPAILKVFSFLFKGALVETGIPKGLIGKSRVRNSPSRIANEVGQRGGTVDVVAGTTDSNVCNRRQCIRPSGSKHQRTKVEICYGMLLDPIGKVFTPFGRANKAVLK